MHKFDCRNCEAKYTDKEIKNFRNICPQCGKEINPFVSEAANTTRFAIGCFVFPAIGFLALVLLAMLMNQFSPELKLTPDQLRTEQIERGFSDWDGSHVVLTEAVKMSLNDPNSFEHVETSYWDQKDHLIVKMKYRAKNTHGGVITKSIKAKTDLNGGVIEIISTK